MHSGAYILSLSILLVIFYSSLPRINFFTHCKVLFFILVVMDGLGMPANWDVCLLVPLCWNRGYCIKCSCYRAVKFAEHAKKVVRRALEERCCKVMTVDKVLFRFMSVKRTLDASFILRML